MVVTKKADEDFLLDSYSAERSENAARVLRDSGRMLRVATMPNAAAQAVRDFLVHRLLGFSSVSTIAAQQLSELAVGYDHSPLNGGELRGSGFPRPGHRMPADFAFGASSSVSFTLIVGEGVNVNTRHQGLRDILEIHNGNTGLVDGLCLVRPDGYVAMTTDANGWDDIVSYLDRILQKDVR